jgi:hypothetical protein
MNLFNFNVNFRCKEACRLNFKEQHDKIGINSKCGSKIFGYRVVGLMNVKSVEVEFL